MTLARHIGRLRVTLGLSWDFGDGMIFMRNNMLDRGLCTAPTCCRKLVIFLVRCLIREGFPDCIKYLDDFCTVRWDADSCHEAQRALVKILGRVGFYISFKKLTATRVCGGVQRTYQDNPLQCSGYFRIQ